MKFISVKNIVTALALSAVVFSIQSCVKDKFNAPTTTSADPAGLYATMTISQFKNSYFVPNMNNPFPFRINDSVILSGVINADDRSGNIYKTLIFQDSTGGLQIVADLSDLYNFYPVGTRIFVKCKGLYLYNYSGTLELGSYIDTTKAQPSLGGIPAANLSTYVVKGKTGLTVTPKHWTLFNLTNAADQLNDQSTLIEVDDVQFRTADTSKTYADAINKAFGSLVLSDCSTPVPNTLTVRSSGFATFATTKPAPGHGSVLGIFTIYQQSNGTSVNQMTIRDTTDVQLVDPARCP
jgi:hypothetical protein